MTAVATTTPAIHLVLIVILLAAREMNEQSEARTDRGNWRLTAAVSCAAATGIALPAIRKPPRRRLPGRPSTPRPRDAPNPEANCAKDGEIEADLQGAA